MKTTFLLHLVPVGAASIDKVMGSLTFFRQGNGSPETAMVNLNGIVEHCPIESMSLNDADADLQSVSGRITLSTGFICIHLGIAVDKQNLTGAVGGIARYTTAGTGTVTVMTVHGHMLPEANEPDREGATASNSPDRADLNDPWEGNTGW